jgi:hypothetical protein
MANLPAFDADGYTGLSLTEVLENLKENVFNASALGPEVSTGDHTVLGMHLEANAIELSCLYDLLGDIVASGDIDSSEGVQQDNLNRQRGAVRNDPRNSTAIVSCGGVNGTTIAVGSLVSIGSDGERWLTNVEIEIAGGSTDVAVTAENTGAIEAAIGAINTIVTTTTGWNTVTNAADAEEGEAVESDADYRLRSEDTGTGTTTAEALFTRLSELDDVGYRWGTVGDHDEGCCHGHGDRQQRVRSANQMGLGDGHRRLGLGGRDQGWRLPSRRRYAGGGCD